METSSRPRLDVVLPVHDEEASITRVLEELHAELVRVVTPRLIVCEDGSSDHTLELLHGLASHLPLEIHSRAERRGYAAAVIAGLGVAETPFVLVMDADGQCDPRDIPAFLRDRDAWDVTVGNRSPRADVAGRRLVSRGFGVLHRALFHTPVHDPSCPFALLRRDTLEPLLPRLGTLEFGFWWELVARAHRAGLSIREVPIHHRPRLSGGSRAFPLRRLPGLAASHVAGLVRVRLESSL